MVGKCHERPALLDAADLDPVRALVGDGAIEYAQVIGGFHFVNRIADLLEVPPEMLPAGLRRFEWIRRMYIRVFSRLLRAMDMNNRRFGERDGESFEEAAAGVAELLECSKEQALADLEPVRSVPKIAEALRLTLEERELRSTLDRETVRRVHEVVLAALPTCAEDASGLHARPSDPVEAFAFVGTRYAARTTEAMIDALRGEGMDDLAILDLAVAVADANQWFRNLKLMGLPLSLFLLSAH